MVAFGPDNRLGFSKGAMTSCGIVGLDTYKFGWLRRLPHAPDLLEFDVVLTGMEGRNRRPAEWEEAKTKMESRARTGTFVRFGIRAHVGQRIVAALPATAVMGCDPDGAGLKLVARDLHNVGFIAGGRVGALEPYLGVAGPLLLAAYGNWLILEPLEWTSRGGLWVLAVLAALSLNSLGARVVFAGSALAFVVVALLDATSCTPTGLGSWARELIRSPAPTYLVRLAGVVQLAIVPLHTAGVG